MFDIGFSEVLLTGTVALVVLGPERLPIAARTVGRWWGKLQRYVHALKADLHQQLELDELRQLQQHMQQQAQQMEQSLRQEIQAMQQQVHIAPLSPATDLLQSSDALPQVVNTEPHLHHNTVLPHQAHSVANLFGWNFGQLWR